MTSKPHSASPCRSLIIIAAISILAAIAVLYYADAFSQNHIQREEKLRSSLGPQGIATLREISQSKPPPGTVTPTNAQRGVLATEFQQSIAVLPDGRVMLLLGGADNHFGLLVGPTNLNAAKFRLLKQWEDDVWYFEEAP